MHLSESACMQNRWFCSLVQQVPEPPAPSAAIFACPLCLLQLYDASPVPLNFCISFTSSNLLASRVSARIPARMFPPAPLVSSIFSAQGISMHFLCRMLSARAGCHPASGSVPQTSLQVPSQPLFHQPVPHFSRHSPRFHRLSCSRVLSVLHHAGCFLCPLPPTQ